MEIHVNGKRVQAVEDEKLAALLERLGFDPHAVVVEYNEHVLPASRFAETNLAAGDVLEVLHFVGGG